MTMFTSDISQVAADLNEAARIGGLLGDATAHHLASGGKAWRAKLVENLLVAETVQ